MQPIQNYFLSYFYEELIPENVSQMLTLIPHAKIYLFIRANLDFKAIDSLGVTMNRYSSSNRQILGCLLSEEKKIR